MRIKFSFTILIIITIVASFILGGYCFHPNSVKPDFDVFPGDSLLVTRVLPADTIYLSEDSASYELIHYIQLGTAGSCCCLKVSDHGVIKEYYGMFIPTDSGLQYTFADHESGKAIVR